MKPQLRTIDSWHTNLRSANKPTVCQAKCIWKQMLPFSPVECASYGNIEKLARPPIRCLHNGFTKSNRAGFVHGTCLCMSLLLQAAPQHHFPCLSYLQRLATCEGSLDSRGLLKQIVCAPWFWQKHFTCGSMDGCPPLGPFQHRAPSHTHTHTYAIRPPLIRDPFHH